MRTTGSILVLSILWTFPGAFAALQAQGSAQQRVLSLPEARRRARLASPELVAAREALNAAIARERQAGAWPNPLVALNREQTSGGGASNTQNIATIEQRIEIAGQRSARRSVAEAQRGAAQARLSAAEARLDFEVTRAYARAVSADVRVRALERTGTVFGSALRASQQRLAAGDISGYDNRRLTLEAARQAALRAEARAVRRSAVVALALLVADTGAVPPILSDSTIPSRVHLSLDSLTGLALAQRAEIRALAFEAQAAHAEAGLIRRERTPTPSIVAGFKNERASSGPSLSGFVAGVAVPLPLWDRRGGAVDAAAAESRRRSAEADSARRQTVREITETYVTHQMLAEQIDTLRAALGPSADTALRAVETAYAEGEIPLISWLDAVRAYQEAEVMLAGLLADYLISRSALERVAGMALP